MDRPIVVVDYDPEWPRHFTLVSMTGSRPSSATLRRLTIEHVGSSTSVLLRAWPPGKPVIDLDVVEMPEHHMQEAVRRLAHIGCRHRGDLGITGREAFTSIPGLPAHHLYVCRPDTQGYLEHITALRDYLRQNSDAARAYGMVKKRLRGSSLCSTT